MKKVIKISSVATPEPHNVTIESDSNKPTKLYGYGCQQPIIPPSLNFPLNRIKVLTTMAVMQQIVEYSPQTLEPLNPSPITTPPMYVSTIEGWETPHTTTDDNTFYSEGEPRRV